MMPALPPSERKALSMRKAMLCVIGISCVVIGVLGLCWRPVSFCLFATHATRSYVEDCHGGVHVRILSQTTDCSVLDVSYRVRPPRSVNSGIIIWRTVLTRRGQELLLRSYTGFAGYAFALDHSKDALSAEVRPPLSGGVYSVLYVDPDGRESFLQQLYVP